MLTAMGTARRIDALGRVVVPVEMRRMLGIDEGDLLDIHVEDARIVMARIEHRCVFCNSNDELRAYRDRLVCRNCVDALTAPA